MIDRDDLRAAVSAGLLTEAQAASLSSLADSRRGARENLSPSDEPFELFRGFNEIFIIVGLVILASGWAAIAGLYLADSFGSLTSRMVSVAAFGAVLLWLLSEYFIRRRRMVGPAIVLSIMWAGNAAFGFIAQFAQVFMVAQEDFSSIPIPTC